MTDRANTANSEGPQTRAKCRWGAHVAGQEAAQHSPPPVPALGGPKSVEGCGRDSKSNGSGPSVKTIVPYCNGDISRSESEGTCKMDCVGSTKSVKDCQLTGHPFDIC